MVLDQASLSRAGWQGIVDQMRNDFKAPFAAEDGPAIVDYLVNLKNLIAQSAGRQPDVNHGAVTAAQGTAAGAPPCAQCHAFNGVSDASGAFPRLAGQSAYYLAGQLRELASGVRASALMSPIAKALSPDDIADDPLHDAVKGAAGIAYEVHPRLHARLDRRQQGLAEVPQHVPHGSPGACCRPLARQWGSYPRLTRP
jgi:cytochrome c553